MEALRACGAVVRQLQYRGVLLEGHPSQPAPAASTLQAAALLAAQQAYAGNKKARTDVWHRAHMTTLIDAACLSFVWAVCKGGRKEVCKALHILPSTCRRQWHFKTWSPRCLKVLTRRTYDAGYTNCHLDCQHTCNPQAASELAALQPRAINSS